MKKKLILLCGTLVVAVAVALAIQSNSSVRIAQVMLDSVEALSQNESGSTSHKSMAVMCHNDWWHSWGEGCCPGYTSCNQPGCEGMRCN